MLPLDTIYLVQPACFLFPSSPEKRVCSEFCVFIHVILHLESPPLLQAQVKSCLFNKDFLKWFHFSLISHFQHINVFIIYIILFGPCSQAILQYDLTISLSPLYTVCFFIHVFVLSLVLYKYEELSKDLCTWRIQLCFNGKKLLPGVTYFGYAFEPCCSTAKWHEKVTKLHWFSNFIILKNHLDLSFKRHRNYSITRLSLNNWKDITPLLIAVGTGWWGQGV